MNILSRVVAVVATLYSSCAGAQNVDPSLFEICKSVFVDGSRDVKSYSSDVEKARSYFRGVCSIDASSHDEFKQKARGLNTSADTAYGFFKLKYNDQDDYSLSKSSFKLACDRTNDESYLREIVSEFSSQINTDLGDVFNGCINNISAYAKGQSIDVFQTYMYQGNGGLDFSVYINYAIDRSDDQLVISSISPDFVECRHGGKKLEVGDVLPSERAVQQFPIDCKRPKNEEITFTIGADGASSNKMTVAVWNDPLPEMRSRSDALASQLSSLRENLALLKGALNSQFSRLNTESLNDYSFQNASPECCGGGYNPTTPPGRCPIGQYVAGIQPYRHRSGHLDIIFQCAKLPTLAIE